VSQPYTPPDADRLWRAAQLAQQALQVLGEWDGAEARALSKVAEDLRWRSLMARMDAARLAKGRET
jgi:hypothetical protein